MGFSKGKGRRNVTSFCIGILSCGGRIRTDDLRVMSSTSCRCSTPLQKYTAGLTPSRPRAVGVGRRRRPWRGGDQVEALLWLRIAVEPGLLLVRRAGGDGQDVFVIALVLGRQDSVLPAQVGRLLAELVPDVRLLREGDAGPDGGGDNRCEEQCMAHSERAGAHGAGGDYGFAVSHAASCSGLPA